MPLSCWLGHRHISTLPGSYKAVSSHQGQGFILQAMHSSAFPFTKSHHTLLSCAILLLQADLHGINPPVPWPTHWGTSSTLFYIDPLSNPVILELHVAEPLENTFINLFIYILCHSTQLPYPFIRDFTDIQQTSEVVHLYSPNSRPRQWLMQDPITLKPQTPSINQRPSSN